MQTARSEPYSLSHYEPRPLPYAYEALEPFLSKETLTFHHDRHYVGYIAKMKEILKMSTQYREIEDLVSLIERAREQGDQKLFQNAAQVWNHEFYFESLLPKPQDEFSQVWESSAKEVKDLLSRSFGSPEKAFTDFLEKSKNHFGSGWSWFVFNRDLKKIEVFVGHDAETPAASRLEPLLGCDLWEHAYYLDYQNERDRYLKTAWAHLNWDFLKTNLQKSAGI